MRSHSDESDPEEVAEWPESFREYVYNLPDGVYFNWEGQLYVRQRKTTITCSAEEESEEEELTEAVSLGI